MWLELQQRDLGHRHLPSLSTQAAWGCRLQRPLVLFRMARQPHWSSLRLLPVTEARLRPFRRVSKRCRLTPALLLSGDVRGWVAGKGWEELALCASD